MFEDTNPGACLSCGFLGFLSKRDGLGGIVYELDADKRWNGRVSSPPLVTIWCFRRMARLDREISEAEAAIIASGTFRPEFNGHTPLYLAMREVFLRPREECVKNAVWQPYVEYFDPRWHYEDWQMRSLAESQQRVAELEVEVSKALLQSQDVSQTILSRLENQQIKADRSGTQLMWTTIVLAVVGLLLAAAQVLTATPDSLIVTWIQSWDFWIFTNPPSL